ncbi:MAG: nuclear transport factor 2 family protein [Parachlamydiaceae bacterium]|nr:nuclear transport factor 2 family protein [Parachlamydiaceae bacterium]
MALDNSVKAEEYYKLIGEKNIEGVKNYLDPDVEFYSPLASLKGREAVAGATGNFMNAIASLKIRAKFGSEDEAVIVYDVDIPGVVNNFPGVSLLTFRNNLILRIELFHDASHFAKKKEEIFS